jgi:hypothetical protein
MGADTAEAAAEIVSGDPSLRRVSATLSQQPLFSKSGGWRALRVFCPRSLTILRNRQFAGGLLLTSWA